MVDTGNTISKMRADVATAGDTLDYYSGLHTEIKGETIPASAKNLHITIREPYGVVGRIIPFNHPIKFAANALAAPLMAGNCVVLKPPETSPLSATMLGEICREVLPAGVVNIVTGTGLPTGDAIARHPKVKRVAFTGSVPTGRAIQRAAAEGGVKHVTLELGRQEPADRIPRHGPGQGRADRGRRHELRLAGPELRLDQPAAAARVAATSRCWSAWSIAWQSLKLGDPLDDKSQMGPINSKRHYERVISMVQSGVSDGAKLMTGGKRPPGSDFTRGYWLEPTVFADVNPGMRIAKEEIFGPVLSVFTWKDEAEALELANATEYGLTASIFTNDIKTAFRVARAVKSGYVWINGASGHFYGTPFGGFKNSGLGREEGIDELLELHRGQDHPRAARRIAGEGLSIAAAIMATNPRFDLAGRTVIVTGGGKGIGKVYAQEFAKAGARVVAADIDEAAAKAVAEAIAADGGSALGLGTDIASEQATEAMAQRGAGTLRRHRRADQQRLADERAAAPLLAGNPGRGMGPRDGGQPARHVPLLPRGVPGDESARPRQDRQHLLVALLRGHAQPAALHDLEGRRGRLHARAGARGRRVRHHRQRGRARHDRERHPGGVDLGQLPGRARGRPRHRPRAAARRPRRRGDVPVLAGERFHDRTDAAGRRREDDALIPARRPRESGDPVFPGRNVAMLVVRY